LTGFFYGKILRANFSLCDPLIFAAGEDGAIDLRYQSLTVAPQPEDARFGELPKIFWFGK
jgi:hypothetical protein